MTNIIEQSSSGARVNVKTYGSTPDKDWLSWATTEQQKLWTKPGVILWDEKARTITYLHEGQALDLLNRMRASKTWRTEGLDVNAQALNFILPELGKAREEQGVDAAKQPLPVPDVISLSPTQLELLLPILEEQEAVLRQALARETDTFRDSINKAQTLLFSARRAAEVKRTDLNTRRYPWTKHQTIIHPRYISANLAYIWQCDLSPNRGTVQIALNGLMWQGWLERPGCLKRDLGYFPKLADALSAVEEALAQAAVEVSVAAQPAQREWLSLSTLTSEH